MNVNKRGFTNTDKPERGFTNTQKLYSAICKSLAKHFNGHFIRCPIYDMVLNDRNQLNEH